MHRTLLALGVIGTMFTSLSAAWSQDLRWSTRQSAHDVPTTVERLVAAIEKRGAKVAARVDHAAAAKTAGLELRPTTVLIFGNPKLGTPLMQEDQRLGLELPLRVLVWQDAAGSVFVGYVNPQHLVEPYGVSKSPEVVKMMAEALAAMTVEATTR